MIRPIPFARAALLLATLGGGALVARAAAPAGAPTLSADTRAVLAGGIDSLGLARVHAAGAESTLAVISRVPADVPQAALDARLAGVVHVRVRVRPDGLPDSVRALDGDPRLRASAAAAARWWIFAPPGAPTWTSVSVSVDGREDVDPLVPDVLAIAAETERAGDLQAAIDAWTGALARVGRHPTIRNEWAVREHAVRLALRMSAPPRLAGAMSSRAVNARGMQAHTVASSDHADLVTMIDQALNVAPWWGEAYQWRAASLASCGRGLDAMRSLELFRIASRDSSQRGLAERALAGLAAGDTLRVSEMLKRGGKQFNTDADAPD